MAQFCTKCGAPMQEGMQFCTSCGATSAAPAAPAPQAPKAQSVAPVTPVSPPAPAPMTPAAPVAAPPPAQKSGSPVVKIILGVVIVIIIVVLLAAASCAYMFYRGRQKFRQIKSQVESSLPSRMGTREVFPLPSNPSGNPGGGPGTSAGPAIEMGDLAYPGATAGQSSNQNIFGAAGFKVQEYFTGDSVDTVLAYYKNKLGNGAMTTESGGNAILQVTSGGSLTTIHIAPDSSSGKTKITISSISKQ